MRRFQHVTVPGLRAPMPVSVVIIDGNPYMVVNQIEQGVTLGNTTFKTTVMVEPLPEVVAEDNADV